MKVVPVFMLKKYLLLFICGLLIAGFYLYIKTHSPNSISSSSLAPDDYFTEQVKPIIDAKCIACHTCTTAPCMLNLSNYEGITRGLNTRSQHQGADFTEAPMTRLGIDATHTNQWHTQFGFKSIIEKSESIFLKAVIQRTQNQSAVEVKAEGSQYCPQSAEAQQEMYSSHPELGMPYGLPALSTTEVSILDQWLQMGAPGPNAINHYKMSMIPSEVIGVVQSWEDFLNQKDSKSRLASRYIYEHLFSGQVYFPEAPKTFFRLIRSSSVCENFKEIPSRRAYSNPFLNSTNKVFYYCFRRFDTAVMDKNHKVYVLNNEKKQRWLELFWHKDWQVKTHPGWDEARSSNPFLTFQDIPAESRYRFLLDDAHYFISTFMKGAVCVSNYAVNSINEHFFVFFLSPHADLSLRDKEYYDQITPLLRLPAARGSSPSLTGILSNPELSYRNKYRKVRANYYQKNNPLGPKLADIWDGDGFNDNALLTVFRHADSAHVLKGLQGDLSKTAFVLDYPLFERLYYNLVAGFDPYGSVAYGLYTRAYMTYIRMEAEELFLSFLPIEERKKIRSQWYDGWLLGTQLQMSLQFPLQGLATPTQIQFKTKNIQLEFVNSILQNAVPDSVRKDLDHLNWKHDSPWLIDESKWSKENPEKAILKKWTSVPVLRAPYVQFFPDISFLRIKNKNASDSKVFSIVRNKEYQNIAWMTNEDNRRDRKSDSLFVLPEFAGSYPNMFFDVDGDQLENFVDQVLKMKSESDYQNLLKTYGVAKDSDNFWNIYNWMNDKALSIDPIKYGKFDLIRYGNRQNE
ncbi:MAG: fatty acid cis/trans isomerase [Pseudobdellovibrionaceae bacterium]